MVRLSALIVLGSLASLGARVPAQDPLRQAEAEYRVSQKRAAELEQRAAALSDRMEKLRSEQLAAVAEIDAAEARITLSGIRLQAAEVRATGMRQRLAEAQRPASMLLAGLATMSRRPPLLAIAGRRDVDALVRTKLLIDATMPTIRRRAKIIEGEAAAAEETVVAAQRARSELQSSRTALEERKRRLTQLEAMIGKEAQSAGESAISAGDSALRAAESLAVLRNSQGANRAMAEIAADLARLDAFPKRAPGASGREGPAGYRLPAAAAVSVGLGTIDEGGVRSRGLTLQTARGAVVVSPAPGIVLFAGPFHDLDGLLIIDHGGGWLSVVTNVSSQLAKGSRVKPGDPVGRALGPVGVELSRDGNYYSPALIAGSSGALSNNTGRR